MIAVGNSHGSSSFRWDLQAALEETSDTQARNESYLKQSPLIQG